MTIDDIYTLVKSLQLRPTFLGHPAFIKELGLRYMKISVTHAGSTCSSVKYIAFRDVSNLFLDVIHHLCVFQSISE